MRFRICAIEFENFKAFSGQHFFELPEDAGLYFVTGRNQFNARLGANGTGKSTLLSDAINWCFYGKTSRGLKAGEIVTWGKRKAMVGVDVIIADEDYTIVRTQSPNAITINGEPKTQEELTQLLRLNQAAFNNSVILPQFGESFLDLTPTAKLTMFSQVMDLDFWLGKSKQAETVADDLEEEIHELENKISNGEGKIEQLRETIEEYQKGLAEFKAQSRAEIEGHEAKKKKFLKKLKTAKREEKRLAGLLAETEDTLKDACKKTKAADDAVSELRKELNDKSATLRSVNRFYNDMVDESKKLDRLKGKVCPTCLQKVDSKHIKAHSDSYDTKLDDLEKEAGGLEASIKKLEKAIKGKEADHAKLHDSQRRLERDNQTVLMDVRDVRGAIRSLENDIDHCDKAIASIKARKNSFLTLIEDAESSLTERKRQIKKHRKELAEVKVLFDSTAFWVKGFKRVRLFVIEDAIAALEVEVNNLLIQLGLVDWKITFDIERENKSGGVTKGFSVFVHSPKHEKPVRFESFSGGEIQRLRMAGDLGLSNLIMEQAGFINETEIVDEPSEHMSMEGIEDLVETISDRAHSNDKQIFLIEHHAIASNLFDGKIVVTSDKKGKATVAYENG